MFLGKFAVGDRIPVTIVTVDGDSVATAADAVAASRAYSPAGTLSFVHWIPKVDFVNHKHYKTIPIPSSLSVQKYTLINTWVIDGESFNTADTFEVISGGDDAGNVISMRRVDRPDGPWIIMHTEDGNITAGYRPY